MDTTKSQPLDKVLLPKTRVNMRKKRLFVTPAYMPFDEGNSRIRTDIMFQATALNTQASHLQEAIAAGDKRAQSRLIAALTVEMSSYVAGVFQNRGLTHANVGDVLPGVILKAAESYRGGSFAALVAKAAPNAAIDDFRRASFSPTHREGVLSLDDDSVSESSSAQAAALTAIEDVEESNTLAAEKLEAIITNPFGRSAEKTTAFVRYAVEILDAANFDRGHLIRTAAKLGVHVVDAGAPLTPAEFEAAYNTLAPKRRDVAAAMAGLTQTQLEARRAAVTIPAPVAPSAAAKTRAQFRAEKKESPTASDQPAPRPVTVTGGRSSAENTAIYEAILANPNAPKSHRDAARRALGQK